MSVLSHFDIQQSEMIDFIMEKVNRRQQPDILHGSLWKALPQFAIPVATTAILEQLFNASDLIARGTSLLAMFPNSITTSVANLKRRLVHVKAALIIGLVAAVTAPFGTWIAGAVSPRVGSIMFVIYLCVLLIRSFFVAVKATRSARASA